MKYVFNVLGSMLALTSYSQETISYNLSDCDSDSFVDFLRDRIVSKEIVDDSLYLRIGFSDNCCINPVPDVIQSNDTLFLSVKNNSDAHCKCQCCFELEMKIPNIRDTNFVLMWDGLTLKTQSKYQKLPHEYLINENTPTNRFNKDNIKVGLWLEQKESGRKYEIYYEEHPKNMDQIKWIRAYNIGGELIEVTIRSEKNNELNILDAQLYQRFFQNK